MLILLPPRPPVLSPIAADGDRPGVPFLIHLDSIHAPSPPPQVTVSSATTRLQKCAPIIEHVTTAIAKVRFITSPLMTEDTFQLNVQIPRANCRAPRHLEGLVQA